MIKGERTVTHGFPEARPEINVRRAHLDPPFGDLVVMQCVRVEVGAVERTVSVLPVHFVSCAAVHAAIGRPCVKTSIEGMMTSDAG